MEGRKWKLDWWSLCNCHFILSMTSLIHTLTISKSGHKNLKIISLIIKTFIWKISLKLSFINMVYQNISSLTWFFNKTGHKMIIVCFISNWIEINFHMYILYKMLNSLACMQKIDNQTSVRRKCKIIQYTRILYVKENKRIYIKE